MLKKLFKKKETPEEIKERILELVEDKDCGIFAPPMDAQVALNELARYLLGDDWYGMAPSARQLNTEIVYEIEMRYRKHRRCK